MSGLRVNAPGFMLDELEKKFLTAIRDCVQTTQTSEGGGVVAQKSTLFNESYLVKLSTNGEGVKNAPYFVYVFCTQPLTKKYKYFNKAYFQISVQFLRLHRTNFGNVSTNILLLNHDQFGTQND